MNSFGEESKRREYSIIANSNNIAPWTATWTKDMANNVITPIATETAMQDNYDVESTLLNESNDHKIENSNPFRYPIITIPMFLLNCKI